MNYDRYIDYMKNVGGKIKIEYFDEDWEPIGPSLRKGMKEAGLIIEDKESVIRLAIYTKGKK